MNIILDDLTGDKKNFNEKFIQSKIKDDPYKNTAFENYYKLTPKTQGNIGESLVTKLMGCLGHNIRKRTDTDHDTYVDDFMVEIKFSVSRNYRAKTTINHVAMNKIWDRLIYLIVYPKYNDYKLMWFTKLDLSYMINDEIFTHQQGGKKGNLDDWTSNSKKMNGSMYIREYSEWKIYQSLSDAEIQQETSQKKNLMKFFPS